MIKRILIPAEWQTPQGEVKRTPAEFTLGVGPCGKTVEELQVVVQEGCLEVTQLAEGQQKVFLYPLAHIYGRIEVEYA